jgi:competence protein ComEC
MDEIGICLALGGLLVGIFAGEHAGPQPATFVLIAGVVALGAAWFVGGRARVAVAVLALALVGCAQMQRALDGQVRSPLSAALAREEPETVTGVLVNDPQSGRFDTDAFVRVTTPGGRRTLFAVAGGDDALRLRVLEAGDRVVLSGRLGPFHPTGFDDRARWRHAIGRLNRTKVLAFAPARGAVALANSLRAVVLRGTAPLHPATRALLSGFLLGDTRAVPDDLVVAYRGSGLSHLLAVSGENVAFTLALFGPLLRRLSLGSRTVGAVAIVLLFATMTRFEPSVLRASALAIVALGSSFVGRPASSVRALALAVIALLTFDPFLAHSVAFWLSCGASAGIATLSPRIRATVPGPAWLRDPLAVSLAAQAGVTPVLLATFGSVPVVTPLANLFAAPAAEAVGVYGMLASAVGGVVPAVAPVLQQPSAVLIAWITTVARAGAAIGVDMDRAAALLTLATAAAVAAAVVALSRPSAPR